MSSATAVLLLAILASVATAENTTMINSYNRSSDCIEPTDEFPRDIFSGRERRHGAIILHFVGFIYGFTLIAMVCRDYFLPSVHCICDDLKIPKDVAAATFMATATSMPEMFVNIIGTFVTESDLGVGTIVGSAVYNTLAVVGLAGLAAPKVIALEWWPLTRDCSIYLIAIGLMVSVLWDSVVKWYEALVLFIFYFLYMAAMFSNRHLHRWAKRLLHMNVVRKNNIASSSSNGCTGSTDTAITIISVDEQQKSEGRLPVPVSKDDSMKTETTQLPLPLPREELIKTLTMKRQTQEKAEEGDGDDYIWKITNLHKLPEGTVFKKLFWFYSWPINVVLLFTIPDCRRPRFRSFYPLTFCMCIVWIGASAYFVSWMISVIGGTFQVADSVMGLTLIAAGGDIPETISSIIMVRRGVGSMGLSNSMGANTLDILLCLSIPWLIKCFLPSNTTRSISIISRGFYINTLFLFGCVILLYLTIVFFKFKMTKKLGAACLFMYVVFIVFTVLIESNVFFYVNPEVCSMDY